MDDIDGGEGGRVDGGEGTLRDKVTTTLTDGSGGTSRGAGEYSRRGR